MIPPNREAKMAQGKTLANSTSTSAMSNPPTPKNSDIDNFNAISKIINDQTKRLEHRIDSMNKSLLSTIETKMDNILEESERRMTNKIDEIENITKDRFNELNDRMEKILKLQRKHLRK